MAGNDPTETGGRFIGRRPGTAPLRYRGTPTRAGRARRRADAVLAAAILVLETLLLTTLWGPPPAAWLGLAHADRYGLRPASSPSSILAPPGARGFGFNRLAGRRARADREADGTARLLPAIRGHGRVRGEPRAASAAGPREGVGARARAG